MRTYLDHTKKMEQWKYTETFYDSQTSNHGIEMMRGEREERREREREKFLSEKEDEEKEKRKKRESERMWVMHLLFLKQMVLFSLVNSHCALFFFLNQFFPFLIHFLSIFLFTSFPSPSSLPSLLPLHFRESYEKRSSWNVKYIPGTRKRKKKEGFAS